MAKENLACRIRKVGATSVRKWGPADPNECADPFTTSVRTSYHPRR